MVLAGEANSRLGTRAGHRATAGAGIVAHCGGKRVKTARCCGPARAVSCPLKEAPLRVEIHPILSTIGHRHMRS